MTKAKLNIATERPSLKFQQAEPAGGLSITAAHREAQRLGNEGERLDYALMRKDDERISEYQQQKAFNYRRTEALLGFIETAIARDAAEALVQIDRIEVLVQEMHMDGGDEISPAGYEHINLMLESVARVLADMGNVDRTSLSWCGGIGHERQRGFVPHSKVAA